ncbi:phosphotransferase enzyme family protein [Novosphingobium sp. JCM 18896]|uniref:phosphotransferase enzyme family protein n=1 Tax=Novosphingobium sp. JCM 18896 TaxID=2989731 RepID=UPI00222162F4|nr:phosphotransferase [Novosphingobium sp. JCM 18896]MCW1430644.1 phosphotransferase [Novosphingobium sp. JCM 18896]
MSGAAPPARHLVHGMGMAMEAPTWPVITADEAEAVLALFPEAGRVERLCWHSPRPFSAATLVAAECGDFVLKRHHSRLRSVAALVEEHAFIAHLRSAGLTVPEVLASAEGVTAVSHGDWTYELHRKAPGLDLYRDRQSWTPFLSAGHAHAAGVALARLHQAACGFTAGERGAWPLVSSLTILPAHDPIAAAEAYVAARPALEEFLAGKPWRAELARLFAALADGLADLLERQPRLWTHNDWHPSNILWSEDGTASAIFDFGLAAPTCALHDLATAIERTAIPWLELAGGSAADVETALAILAGYRSVIALTEDDVAGVLRLLPLIHIEFALSEADYFAGIVGDDAQAQVAWQDYLVDHADWFLGPEGRTFLRDLASGASS